MTDSNIVYQARLHGILFFWPAVLFCLALFINLKYYQLNVIAVPLSIIAVLWGIMMWLKYYFCYLTIKQTQIILSTGVLVRQTIDISTNKIESIDIRQSVIGTIFSYGTIIITGTGGTRQFINYINKPLTCRRYIEQLMHK